MLAQTYTYTSESTGLGIGILILYLIGAVIGLACFVINILNIIDYTKHTDAAWAASGQSKSTALVVIILGFVCCNLLALYYWFGIKPSVTAAEQPGWNG